MTASERSSQVAPPSRVVAIAPQSPTTHTVRASITFTLKRSFSGGIALFSGFQVLPPSAVARIVDYLPTIQPCSSWTKSTAKSGTLVLLSRACQVLPASAVWKREPELPAAHASLALIA